VSLSPAAAEGFAEGGNW